MVTYVHRFENTNMYKGTIMIVMHTNYGPIKIELAQDKAPETCKNFLAYVESGHFDGTIFHRVIDNFMIQGGGFTTGMTQKPTKAPIKNEAKTGLKNVTGTLAMARTSDPHSATCQFFINTKDNAFLDFTAENVQGYGYCAFATVVEGMDVVNKISKVQTGTYQGHGDVPRNDVIIEKVEIV